MCGGEGAGARGLPGAFGTFMVVFDLHPQLQTQLTPSLFGMVQRLLKERNLGFPGRFVGIHPSSRSPSTPELLLRHRGTEILPW